MFRSCSDSSTASVTKRFVFLYVSFSARLSFFFLFMWSFIQPAICLISIDITKTQFAQSGRHRKWPFSLSLLVTQRVATSWSRVHLARLPTLLLPPYCSGLIFMKHIYPGFILPELDTSNNRRLRITTRFQGPGKFPLKSCNKSRLLITLSYLE